MRAHLVKVDKVDRSAVTVTDKRGRTYEMNTANIGCSRQYVNEVCGHLVKVDKVDRSAVTVTSQGYVSDVKSYLIANDKIHRSSVTGGKTYEMDTANKKTPPPKATTAGRRRKDQFHEQYSNTKEEKATRKS